MKLIFAVLALALVFLGCLGAAEQDFTGGTGSSRGGISAPEAPPADYSGGGIIAKSGSISLKVPEGTLQGRFDSLRSALEDQGAQLGDVTYTEYGDRKQYSVTIRVLPSKFEQVMDSLKAMGEVKDISVRLEDVTKQYVELEVRIENRELELSRLRALYNRTDEVSEILEIERELTRVETELEILKQQKQDIQSRVDRSTIVISMYEETPAVNKLTVSLENLAAMFFGAVAAAITLIVLAVGFLLPLALLGVLIWLGYKRFLARKR